MTKEQIKKAIETKIIKFEVDPNLGSGTVCQIGENWFYFGGLTAEELNPDEYIRDIPLVTIVDEIFDALEDFCVHEEFMDEYEYYNSYLNEQLNLYQSTSSEWKNLCDSLNAQNGLNAHGFETDGDIIYCDSNEKAAAVADFLEAVYGFIMLVKGNEDDSVFEIYPG